MFIPSQSCACASTMCFYFFGMQLVLIYSTVYLHAAHVGVGVFSHNRIWPVDRALVIHSRSSVLKGTRTKLTLAARFLALSGYMK